MGRWCANGRLPTVSPLGLNVTASAPDAGPRDSRLLSSAQSRESGGRTGRIQAFTPGIGQSAARWHV
jgi:hypothetical protein